MPFLEKDLHHTVCKCEETPSRALFLKYKRATSYNNHWPQALWWGLLNWKQLLIATVAQPAVCSKYQSVSLAVKTQLRGRKTKMCRNRHTVARPSNPTGVPSVYRHRTHRCLQLQLFLSCLPPTKIKAKTKHKRALPIPGARKQDSSISPTTLPALTDFPVLIRRLQPPFKAWV